MAKEHKSPEERLLALIRGKPKKPQASAPDAPLSKDPVQEAAPHQQKAEKPKGIHPGGLFKPSVFKHGRLDPSALKALNRGLVVFTALLGIYLFIEIFFVKPKEDIALQIPEEKIPAGRISPESVKVDLPGARDYSFYSSEITNKNIFGQAQGEEGSPQQVMAAPEDVASALGLVGVIAGDNPQAVIEDKKAQKTYYLIKGQSFNGMTVEEISEGKVVLDYQGKKIALLL